MSISSHIWGSFQNTNSKNYILQVIACEGVTTVEFADTFSAKNDYTLSACCLVGTSLGSVIFIIINLPDRGDPRTSEPVVVSPSATLFRIRGSLLNVTLFECSAQPLTIREDEPLENVRSTHKAASTVTATHGAHQSTNSIGSSGSSTTVGCDSTVTNNTHLPQGDQQVSWNRVPHLPIYKKSDSVAAPLWVKSQNLTFESEITELTKFLQ